jgi:hypothetical protein
VYFFARKSVKAWDPGHIAERNDVAASHAAVAPGRHVG